jgi:hypothetical protein
METLKMRAMRFQLMLGLLLLIGIVPCLAQSPFRAERPVVRVGDSTVYRDLNVRTGEKRDTTFVLATIDANKIVSQTSGATSGFQTFTRDWNLVKVKDRRIGCYDR